jgi:hypothetical protein
MMFGAGFVCVGCVVVWAPAAALGIDRGRRAETPGSAFWRGLLTAFLFADLFSVAGGLTSLVLGAIPDPVCLEWFLLALASFGLPPALLAAAVALVAQARLPQRPPINPDVETAARSHFIPGRPQPQPPTGTDAVRPADNRVSEDIGGRPLAGTAHAAASEPGR